jgi:hypothetical protein
MFTLACPNYSSLLTYSLVPRSRPSRAQVVINFYSVNLVSSLPHFRLPFHPHLNPLPSRARKSGKVFLPGPGINVFPSANLFVTPRLPALKLRRPSPSYFKRGKN